MTNLNQAIETATKKAANHPEWLRAITKAAAMLQSGELCVTLFADNTALVTSPNGSYVVNGTCPCAARTSHCYHRAAKRLVEMAEAEPVATKAATRDELISAIKRTIHPFDLLSRFHTTDFQLFATETLADIVAAIA